MDDLYFSDDDWKERVERWLQREKEDGNANPFLEGNVQIIRQIMEHPETGLRVVINISSDALLSFLADGRYRNLYEEPVIGGKRRTPSPDRVKVDSLLGFGAQDPSIWLNYSDLQYPDKRSALLLAVHNRAAGSDLHAFIRVFAEATLIECARRFGPYLHRAEYRDLVQSWASVLWFMDLWDRFQDFEEILKYCGLGSLAHFLSPGPWFRKQLLFSIPCPLRPEWDPRIRFLQ
jgi:hypothetical protein